MIDPIHSLAFSVQANPGVYALLLGSGVSRAAGVPTGWEITLDLIRKLAKCHNEVCEPDPAQWYLKKFKKAADYSDLLDNLAKTQTERQQLLRPYFEPNDQELEIGAKQPTTAHHAIAQLVKQGFVKVVITTNFDRLIEKALDDAGIVPTILSSPDHVKGAPPFTHIEHCVFKVHGDYLDTRIRNTPDELKEYPKEFDEHLDHIFDDFGLIICGWSADWDEALRKAIYRAPSRRFSTYWAVYGHASDQAQKLINHRSAQKIIIKDADQFFQDVQETVQSLEEYSNTHPLSTEAVVASLKRYLPEPRHRIRLADLISNEVDRIVEATSTPNFAMHGDTDPNNKTTTARVRSYDAACSTLLAMAPIGGFYAEEEHLFVWQQALERLSMPFTNGLSYNLWRDLQRYPGTLLLYALGLGLVASDQLEFLGRIFMTKGYKTNGEVLPVVQLLPPFCLFESSGELQAQFLEGVEQSPAPLNDWLHNELRQYTQRLIPNDDQYTLIFDRLEILIALGYAYQTEQHKDNGWFWTPPGKFMSRYGALIKHPSLQEIEDDISDLKNESPFVKSGIFGETPEFCLQGLADLKKFVSRHRRY